MISSVATPVSFRSAVRTGGAIGAATGAALGSMATSLSCAGGAGLAAHLALTSVPLPAACLGPIGIGLAAVLGLTGGALLEHKLHAGKVTGALLGGTVGCALGGVVGAVGVRPSARTAAITDSFCLTKLPGRVVDPMHDGNLRSNPQAVAALHAAQPGDVLLVPAHLEIVNSLEKLAGGTGDYGHCGIVEEGNKIIDLVDKGPREQPTSAYEQYSELVVLRPRYATLQEAWNVVDGAKAAIRTVTYDDYLSMPKPGQPTDGKEYCTEFVYNRLREAAPEIHLQPTTRFGQDYVLADTFFNSPDMVHIYDSDSNYWRNHLRRFC